MDDLVYNELDINNDSEVAEVARIHCTAPREWVPDHDCSSETLRQTEEYLCQSGPVENLVLLAKTPDDDIVGMHWVRYDPNLRTPQGDVLSLWIHKDYRGRDIATKLKQFAKHWLLDRGAQETRDGAATGSAAI